MSGQEIALQVISIVFSSSIAIVAVIISIISINKQTKSQNINANIQLFDKRFEIYLYTIELFYIVGYFDGILDLSKKQNFKDIIKFVKNAKLTHDIQQRITSAYKKSRRFEIMQKCLFSGKISIYLDSLLSNFTDYISGIYDKTVYSNSENAYKNILKIYETHEFFTEELKNYIYLYDVKRYDI